jgi:hypothetical protein
MLLDLVRIDEIFTLALPYHSFSFNADILHRIPFEQSHPIVTSVSMCLHLNVIYPFFIIRIIPNHVVWADLI